MKRENKSVLMYLAVTVFVVFTVFLYGPYSLYLPNAEEFWFSISDITKVILPVSAISAAVMFFLQFLLPAKAGKTLCKIIMGIGLGLYVQGNFINISYGTGVMDGTPVQWQWYTKYGFADTFAWALCIAALFLVEYILRRKQKEQMFVKTVIAAACFLTAVQVPAFAVQLATFRPEEFNEVHITTDGEFELGTDKNIVIFVLDTLDERYYQDFVDSNPDYIKNLDGFIHYDNALSSGARTIIGFPSMFTGVPFTETETYGQYKDTVWSEYSPLKLLYEEGYDVGVYSEKILFSEENTLYFSNFKNEKNSVGSWKTFTAKVYQLVAARFFPHYLKKFVWMDTADFDVLVGETDTFSLNNVVFAEDYRKSRLSFGDELKQCVRVYHLKGAHEPFIMDSSGNEKEDAALEETVAGCFNVISEYLNNMKELGIYDDSTIIITADHGDKHKAEYPVFLVKDEHSEEEYKTDHSPVSLFDLSLFLADKAGRELDNQIYGKPLGSLQEGDSRERHLFYNSPKNGMLIIEEFVTDGEASDIHALKLLQTHESKEGTDSPYKLGEELLFNADATGTRYLTEGRGVNNGFDTKLKGPAAQLIIPIEDYPKDGELKVFIKYSKKSAMNMTYQINANGTEVYTGETSKKSADTGIEFSIPVSVLKGDGVLTLDLNFQNVEEDGLTLRLEKMVIDRG